ncbi:hypothetical protein IV494_02555 [Kaistella sp. G5-32]|uniref:Uncharacterized protein n=1 Tax=Kaistella gelatinilytica TaxID=2787636 RepID=A0ABS0F8L8_9FLAO|nr:hypothetical protein [Kaistella gelatinilytica]MBF8456051.1 hypothetical protein [Kaistella gelatinilytica]
MKKLIFKFWIFNLLLSLSLYIGFRIVISNTETEETNTFEFILYIMKFFLDLYVIGLFSLVMIVCSATYFLNLNDRIRNNTFSSFLTFLGIPVALVLFYLIQFTKDFQTEGLKGLLLLDNYFIVSFIYIFLATILFLVFRRKVAKI